MQKTDMNQIVGKCHILFVCIDSLRYDVASEEQEKGETPVLNRYGPWQKCQAPGNFTYPSHQAMFAGFFPIEEGILDMKKRKPLFFLPGHWHGASGAGRGLCVSGRNLGGGACL